MPARYVILKEQKLVVSIGWDRLTFADFTNQQEQFLADPDFDPSFDQLVDGSRVTALDLSVEQAKIISRRAIFLPSSRRAVVATDPAIFGMGRMMDAYHTLATKRELVGVFYDRASALKWLGRESIPDY